MPIGQSAMPSSAPIGTAGVASPYGMASAGVGGRRVQGQFVPLSVFFLQMDGEDAEDGEPGAKSVTGYVEKGKKPDVPKKPIGKVSFDKDTANQTRAMKGPRPKAKERKEESKLRPTERPQKCSFCTEGATKSLLWAEGRAYIPVCDKHEQKARGIIVDKNDDEVAAVHKIKNEDTTSANVAAYPVPIGKPLRRMGEKGRKRWMDRLAQHMGK